MQKTAYRHHHGESPREEEGREKGEGEEKEHGKYVYPGDPVFHSPILFGKGEGWKRKEKKKKKGERKKGEEKKGNDWLRCTSYSVSTTFLDKIKKKRGKERGG